MADKHNTVVELDTAIFSRALFRVNLIHTRNLIFFLQKLYKKKSLVLLINLFIV